MIYNYKVGGAIEFATKIHEIDQKQKRKGSGIPYITHPLKVALLLSIAGADEDTVIAGILHDTVEDSIESSKVTIEDIEKRFGKKVAELVASVTEDKSLSWDNRKNSTLSKVEYLSHESLLIKSADLICNMKELLQGYSKDKDEFFHHFNSGKEKILIYNLSLITKLIKNWEDNPLKDDLRSIGFDLQRIGKFQSRAEEIKYEEYHDELSLRCPICGWGGSPKNGGIVDYTDDLMDVRCPNCNKMLLVVDIVVQKKTQKVTAITKQDHEKYEELLKQLHVSLQKDADMDREYGLNLKDLWKEMLKSLDDENKK